MMDDESYDFWRPLIALGISFCGTSLVCELLHHWNPEWYQKRQLVYPTDKKDKQRQHTSLSIIVLFNVSLSAILLVGLWKWRLSYVETHSLNISNLLFWLPDTLGLTTEVSSWRKALRFPIDFFALEKISQFWFFHMHWLVHKFPVVYAIVHKWHHQYREPSALTAIDCTVWEMLLLNLPAVGLGPLLVLPHPTVHLIWCVATGIYTPVVHSGYNLIPFFNPRYHDEHHRNPTCNFGSPMLDRWYGTNSHQAKE